MKMAAATKSVKSMRGENVVIKLGFAAVLFSNAVLGLGIATRDEAVVLVPPFQNSEIEFINGKANREYYQQWAWSTSMMLGNISPGNAKFIRGEIERIATPQLYRTLSEIVDAELRSIIRDKATVTFSPRSVIYDPELNLFFVEGVQQLAGPGVREPISKKITYELGFVTRRLRVYLDSFDVYNGRPRTEAVRETDLEIERRERDEAEGDLE